LQGNCEPFEHWLVTSDKRRVVRAERMLEICNDGYGAAGVGEDNVDVEENALFHRQSGGSAWRWSESSKWRLSPRALLGCSNESFFAVGPQRLNREWSFEDFGGRTEWYVPTCSESGEWVEKAGENEDGSAGYAYDYVPQVELPLSFFESGWKTTPIGRCSVAVDGDKRGSMIHGQHGGTRDSQMKVVAASPRVLFFEIEDDRFTGPSDRWLNDDHVELWSAPTNDETGSQHCLMKANAAQKKDLVQWGIRLKDGKVFPAFGHPAADELRVETAQPSPSGPVRMKVSLAKDLHALTVVYSDGDDGASQHAMIATSRLRFGDHRSLGHLQVISPKNASCVVRGGKLEPVLK
jgi:hypothetical protein